MKSNPVFEWEPFTYFIRGGEMFISTKVKSITRATVMITYRKAIEVQNAKGYVSGLKRLGTFGASYLYPLFLKLGIITRRPADLLSSDGIAGTEIYSSDTVIIYHPIY